MRSKEAVRHIQHIASLGMHQRIAIPAMVDTLRHVVPANQNPFFWSDGDGMVIDFYGDSVDLSAMESAMVLNRHNTADDVPTMDRLLRGPLLVNNTATLRRLAGWNHSVFYNEMLRGNAAENSIDFQLRDRSGIRGAFAVSRGRKDRPLQAEEMRRVASLVPHFLHAMNAAPAAAKTEYSDSADADFIVATLSGEVVSYSAGSAMRLLQLCDFPLGQGVRFSEHLHRLPACAKVVLDRLQLIHLGHNGQPASLEVPTRWGLFRVSAVPMQAVFGGKAETAMITVRKLVDQRLARAGRLVGTDLTPAERRVALRMADSGDGDAIAQDLGLTVGAYRQYAKRIYAALGVDGRMGVKALLDRRGQLAS
jgi:DNA-binding CsgD family transcriptional regulator